MPTKPTNLLTAVTPPANRLVKVKHIKGTEKVAEVVNLRSPLWEKQANESYKAYQRFILYRDLGSERTYKAVAEEIQVTSEHICDLSSRWRWKERIAAWDKHLAEIRDKAIEDASKTMASRQAKLGMLLQDKAVVALESLAWDVDNPPTAKDVVSLADAGVKIERLARGEKTEDTGGVTINLPMLPTWAKASKYVTVDAENIPLLPEADNDNGKA